MLSTCEVKRMPARRRVARLATARCGKARRNRFLHTLLRTKFVMSVIHRGNRQTICLRAECVTHWPLTQRLRPTPPVTELALVMRIIAGGPDWHVQSATAFESAACRKERRLVQFRRSNILLTRAHKAALSAITVGGHSVIQTRTSVSAAIRKKAFECQSKQRCRVHWFRFECGTRILRVIHGRDAHATSVN